MKLLVRSYLARIFTWFLWRRALNFLLGKENEMRVEYKCLSCGKALMSKEKYIGLEIECPKCGTSMKIPNRATVAKPPTPGSIGTCRQDTGSGELPNTSGQGKEAVVPPEIKRWNWGAFLLSLFWVIGNRVWIGLLILVPFIGFVMPIILGIKGNEWAWRSRRFESIRHFKRVQSAWAKWSLGIYLVFIILPMAASIRSCGRTGLKREKPVIEGGSGKTVIPPVAEKAVQGGEVQWLADLSTVTIPEAKVSGTIHGRKFALENGSLQNGIVTLRQGKDFFPDLALTIFLFLKNNEKAAGKTYNINKDSEFGSPHVYMKWKKPDARIPETKVFMKDYVMRLEFGNKEEKGKLPGKIYICFPDDLKSVVAGTFELEVK